MTVRNTDPETSYESAAQVDVLASKLRAAIVNLAREAGSVGITGNEAERLIPDHKNHSITPRFAELIARGELVRMLLGRSKKGRPIYLKRYDTITKRDTIVNFAPEFAPKTAAVSAQIDLPYSEGDGA
jgi:hypothetical protein